LLCLGHPNKTISQKLNISVSTVEFHRANLNEKLSTNSLAKLIEIYRSTNSAEYLYVDILNRTPDLIWRASLEGEYSFLSSSLCRMTGFVAEVLLNKPFAEWAPLFIAADDIEMAADSLNRRTAGEFGIEPLTFDATLRRKDGSEYIAEICSAPILGSEGQIIGLQGTNRDVTEQRKSLEALKKSGELLQVFFASSKHPAFIMDNAYNKLIDVNEAWQEFFGWGREEVLNQSLIESKLIDDKSHAKALELLSDNRPDNECINHIAVLATKNHGSRLCQLESRRTYIFDEIRVVSLFKAS